jgi:hypothetical protein
MRHAQSPPAAQVQNGSDAEDTVVDPPPPVGKTRVERRLIKRLPARPGARVECRSWGGGPGPDFGLELLDVCEVGIRVRLARPVRPDDRFEVTLRDPDGQKCGRMMAVVRWACCSRDGTVMAGLELGRPLLPEVVRRLAGPAEQPAS